MNPRWYQTEAVAAINKYLRENREGNPCAELPTGSGKSAVLAMLIHQWTAKRPDFRVLVLAHRKELVRQNHDELHAIAPDLNIGIFSAGLRRRDTNANITYASIDSLANHTKRILAPHVILVDEAHRVPVKGEGKYRTLIAAFKRRNPSLRVVGLTATPYRMDSGPICHEDHLLTKLVYSAPVHQLIEEGFLCKLRSKVKEAPDVSSVRKNSGGDFITGSLAEAVDVPNVVSKAVEDAVSVIRAENRKAVMFFCVNQEHCQHVSDALRTHGIDAPVVTAKTSAKERDRIVERFKAMELHAICNVDVYTEGFNARHVDCIVMLRPTLSKGLYSQIVGRGLRTHEAKADCLVLDYAGNIERHGPIDCLDAGEVRLHECHDCGDTFSFAVGACPHCGTEIPKKEREAEEAVQRERKLHEAARAQAEILGYKPTDSDVDDVSVYRHKGKSGIDCLRVEYRCGLKVYREFVCFDHDGYAYEKARQWWLRRFPHLPVPTVDMALDGMFEGDILASDLTAMTKSITTKRNPDTGYDEIVFVMLTPKEGNRS